MRRISWIGVGIMGKAMVRNLMKAGYEVHIYARHPEKVADVISEGAVPHGSIAECVKASEVVITMVGFPKDVEEVYFAPGNILDSAAKGMTLIDMTTTSPTLAQRIYQEGAARGLRVLDAPVTGGDSGARAGTLSILVGGDQADFDACLPIFQAMGTNITYFGPAGCGQHAKMANQIMIAGALSGVLLLAVREGDEGTDIGLIQHVDGDGMHVEGVVIGVTGVVDQEDLRAGGVHDHGGGIPSPAGGQLHGGQLLTLDALQSGGVGGVDRVDVHGGGGGILVQLVVFTEAALFHLHQHVDSFAAATGSVTVHSTFTLPSS